jgi:hypothetical protein
LFLIIRRFLLAPVGPQLQLIGFTINSTRGQRDAWPLWGWAVLIAVGTLAGCDGGSQSAGSSEEGQIRAAIKLLGMEYGGYMASHNGAPPTDDGEMRKHLESRAAELSES